MDRLSELVLRCRARANKEQMNELLQAVHPDLILALKGYSADEALVYDFAQEAMTRVVQRVKSSRATNFREFRAWCITIATRIAADHYRKASVKKLSIMDPAEIEKLREAGAEAESPDFGSSSDVERAFTVLKTLGEPCRELLTLHYVHGLGYAEIGAMMGKNYDAVRVAIARCRSEAQSMFEKKVHYAK
jgi:RNA polymerase sigma-70 factor (ECF subfamily)